MDSSELTRVLMEMQNSLGNIEAQLQSLGHDLESHNRASAKTREDVQELQKELSKAKGAVAALLSLGAIGAALKFLF